MRAWMMALIAGSARLLKSAGPYTSTTIFNVPVSTSKIESITGKGANGTPASSGTAYYREDTTITLYRYPDGTSSAVGPTLIRRTASTQNATLPGDYCDPEQPYTSISAPTGTTSQKCYYFKIVRDDYSISAKTGANTVAFGRTFPGGVGGPATPVTYTDVPVTGGSAQTLTIPSGGSISSFTYYE